MQGKLEILWKRYGESSSAGHRLLAACSTRSVHVRYTSSTRSARAVLGMTVKVVLPFIRCCSFLNDKQS